MSGGWILEKGEVVESRPVGATGHFLSVRAPLTAEKARPGQFAQVRASDALDPLLRRPLSYAVIDPGKGQVGFLFRVLGKGTSLLAGRRSGDHLDLMGPLGRPFPEAADLLVGGGYGVAPLLPLAGKVPLYAGFPSAADTDLLLGLPARVATEDGSVGEKGLVTDILPRLPEGGVIIACGPEGLLRRLHELYRSRRLYVSLEARMACGVGACLGCNISGGLKVCRDGPVFPAEDVFGGEGR